MIDPLTAKLAIDAGKAGLSMATGFIQNVQAKKKEKEANAAMPSLTDPREAAFLSEIEQKRKAIDTGADYAAGMGAIDATNAATQSAITAASGGNVGSTIQGLLAAQRGADTGKGNVLAAGQQQQALYTDMFNKLNSRIAQRSLELQMQKSQQARAEYARQKTKANQNMMAGIGGLTSVGTGLLGGGYGGGSTPSPSSPDMTADTMTMKNDIMLPTTNQDLEISPSFDTSFLSNIASKNGLAG